MSHDFPPFLADLDAALEHLKHVDGVMMGRAAYQEPWRLLDVDPLVFGQAAPHASAKAAAAALIPYIERELARQVNLDTEGRPIEFVTVTYLVCPTSPVTAITLAADEHDAFAWVDPAEVLRRTDVVWHVAPAIAAWREAVR